MDGSYSFQAEPRAVQAKFRPGGTNIHSDPRVARGNTYASALIRQEPGVEATSKPKKKKRLKQTVFDVKPETQKYIPVPLEQYLVEQVVPTESRDESEQTDTFLPEPPVKEYYTRNLPKKSGVDVSTQIEPEDQLFNFDLEVEPLLNVLISKTLEVSLMEVEEEEELKAIRADKARYIQERLEEQQQIMKDEDEEVARMRAKDAERKIQQERVQRERDVSAKVFSCLSVKALVAKAKGGAFTDMEKSGVFFDPDLKMVEDDFMPWLYEKVDAGFKEVVEAQSVVDEIIMASLQQQMAEQAKLQELLELQAEARRIAQAEADEKAKIESETIRIFIESSDLGLDPEDFGGELPDKFGPIPVRETLPLAETEKVIQAWMQENLKGEFETPDGGYLKLALGGADLDMTKPLNEQEVDILDESVFQASREMPDEDE